MHYSGSTPLASYRIVSLEPARSIASYTTGNVNLSVRSSANVAFYSSFLGYRAIR